MALLLTVWRELHGPAHRKYSFGEGPRVVRLLLVEGSEILGKGVPTLRRGLVGNGTIEEAGLDLLGAALSLPYGDSSEPEQISSIGECDGL